MKTIRKNIQAKPISGDKKLLTLKPQVSNELKEGERNAGEIYVILMQIVYLNFWRMNRRSRKRFDYRIFVLALSNTLILKLLSRSVF